MLPSEGGSGKNPRPSPNNFSYPGEETVLCYEDYHAMSGPIQNDDDNGMLSRIFSQYRLSTAGGGEELMPVSEDVNLATEVRGPEMKSGRATRKRASGKTDRHSKIRTAHGLRDRRIRLSVQISRKFFDLQDMLGFDKASSTIEWLIAKSKCAIKSLSLMKGSSSLKDVSADCIVCRNEEAWSISGDTVVGIERGVLGAGSSRGETKRDLRERARVRARERTREKMMARISKFSINEESPNDCPNVSASDGQGDFSSIQVVEKFLGIASASESSLNGDPTDGYYSENVNHSGGDRFLYAYPGSSSSGHFGGYGFSSS